ncbi:hypothetical protein [Arthrobacter dokdonensis]|uniref:hypothetical protein n=1 Tax=Arthrobacter dokdonellae TaxID=2211210 RepID=UPI000DE59E0A|nr:hypothetical protein [Arthrobacter dokdonellae]
MRQDLNAGLNERTGKAYVAGTGQCHEPALKRREAVEDQGVGTVAWNRFNAGFTRRGFVRWR